MNERVIFTVTQVNLYIKSLLERDKYVNNILIKGEISNFKSHTSGHMYMSLKDEGGVMRAVMFKSAASKLKFRPDNGMKIIASGRVSVYERDGQYQLYIEDMQPDGMGALHMAFEQLKEKLSKEGLFDPSKKKPLPKFPKKIGIVTAPTGAAVRDMLNVLRRRFSYSDVCLYPSLVQGENAAEQISGAIDYFNREALVDVVIIGRGGGSIEDLWAFNEEIVARAIFSSEIPIISAVGHEVDFTISDFVADMRAPTPSAAAELVVPAQSELLEKFNNVYSRMFYCCGKMIEQRRHVIAAIAGRPAIQNPIMKINENRMYLDNLEKHFSNAVLNIYSKKRQEFAICASKLDSLSPLGVLKRGYSVAKTSANKVVKSVSDVNAGENIILTLADGDINCKVTD